MSARLGMARGTGQRGSALWFWTSPVQEVYIKGHGHHGRPNGCCLQSLATHHRPGPIPPPPAGGHRDGSVAPDRTDDSPRYLGLRAAVLLFSYPSRNRITHGAHMPPLVTGWQLLSTSSRCQCGTRTRSEHGFHRVSEGDTTWTGCAGSVSAHPVLEDPRSQGSKKRGSRSRCVTALGRAFFGGAGWGVLRVRSPERAPQVQGEAK